MKKIVSKRKFFNLVLITLFAAVAVSGCGDTTDPNTGVSGSVTIAGSTSVQPLSEELALAFMENNPDVRVEVSGGGSSAGVKAAQTGTADIGAASRELKEDETGVEEVVIARDGMVVIINTLNPVEDLSIEQIKKIFTGEIDNWSQVGGEEGDIVVVNREEGSGTRGAFEEIVLGEEGQFVDSAIIQNSTGAVREAVSQDKNAIGYISLGGINDSIKAIKVDGVSPTIDAIKSGEYLLSRPFNYILKEGAQLSSQAQAFLDFVLSEEGQKVVEEAGFVAVN